MHAEAAPQHSTELQPLAQPSGAELAVVDLADVPARVGAPLRAAARAARAMSAERCGGRYGERGARGGTLHDPPATVLRTLAEPAFCTGGSQATPDALGVLASLLPASEELNARRPAAAVTAQAEPSAASASDSYVIPADLRASSAAALGLRAHRSAEARGSHVLCASLEGERRCIVDLIQAPCEDMGAWRKKALGAPVLALLHNSLVRIRRYHRLLEDSQPRALDAETIDGLARMLAFCAAVISESGRSALYNQAVKHLGEFFCYRYVSPPVLRCASPERRPSCGGAAPAVRDALLALFTLVTRGAQLNDASRAAVREALRCAACSDAPPLLLLEASVGPLLRASKGRDDFAVRTREMGLTVVHLALRTRSAHSTKPFLDGPCRTTSLRSNLHALVGVLAAARLDSAKSPLNKQLASLLMARLAELAGERLAGIVQLAEIDPGVADELLAAGGFAPGGGCDLPRRRVRSASASRALRSRAAWPAAERAAALDLRAARAAAPALLCPPGSPPHTDGSSSGASAAGTSLHSSPAERLPEPARKFHTLRSAGAAVTQLRSAATRFLAALPPSPDELAAAVKGAPAARLRAHADDGAPPSLASSAAQRAHSRAPFDCSSSVSDEAVTDLDDEIARVLLLVADCTAAWPPRSDAADALDPELAHACVARIRKTHRLCDDMRREPSALRLHAFSTMLAFVTRIISDGAELSLRQHALTHVAEHFCYKFATRQMLDPPATALGQPLRALHTSLLATLFRLLAANGQADAELLGAEAREAVRCAACSASQPELILQASMDALERALCPGQPCASAALSDASSADEQLCGAGMAAVEVGFEAIDLALGRHKWEQLAPFFEARAGKGGRARLADLVRALALSSEHAGASLRTAALRAKIIATLSAQLGAASLDALLGSDLSGLGAEGVHVLAALLARRASPGVPGGGGCGAERAVRAADLREREDDGLRGALAAEKLAQAQPPLPEGRGPSGGVMPRESSGAPTGDKCGAGGASARPVALLRVPPAPSLAQRIRAPSAGGSARQPSVSAADNLLC